MAVKRRTVWLSDEDWAYLLRCAGDRGMNASQLVHALLPDERVISTINLSDHAPKLAPGVRPQFTVEATRPFTPAPKPIAKRHG